MGTRLAACPLFLCSFCCLRRVAWHFSSFPSVITVFSVSFQSWETNGLRWRFDGAMSVDDRQPSGHRAASVPHGLKLAYDTFIADGKESGGC